MLSLKRTIKFIMQRLRGGDRQYYYGNGWQAYDPSSNNNAGLQGYFIKNEDTIRNGDVPERYKTIAKTTPGRTILELGSADGTQSLVLARENKIVCGVELMEKQYQISLDLKKEWLERGISLSQVDFVLGGIDEFKKRLNGFETVLMSRVIYHLRNDIDDVMSAITQSNISSVVLVGCPERARRFREGGQQGDRMGKYAYYATTLGMETILKTHGFQIVHSTLDEGPGDPIVVGKKHPAVNKAET